MEQEPHEYVGMTPGAEEPPDGHKSPLAGSAQRVPESAGGHQQEVSPGSECEVVEEPAPVRTKCGPRKQWTSGYHLPKSLKANKDASLEVVHVVPDPPPFMGMVHMATHTICGLLDSDDTTSPQALVSNEHNPHQHITLDPTEQSICHDVQMPMCQMWAQQALVSNEHNPHWHITPDPTEQSIRRDAQMPVYQMSAQQALVSNDHNPHQHITPDLTEQSICHDAQMLAYQMSVQQALQVSALNGCTIPPQHIVTELSNYGDVQMSTETPHAMHQTSAEQTLQVSNDHNSDLTMHPDYGDVQMATEVPLISYQWSAQQLLMDFLTRLGKYLSRTTVTPIRPMVISRCLLRQPVPHIVHLHSR
ncbi:hypothetical protein BKA82DRAFT_8014 [Pisolithus tinctorius]|uniref:Uncharacterized protein n=1 Tax=Pisolithus tinctorius Marx 270 TaxID=870435 RepID=A0A0C3P751_PISTI|nr:hypothetical protein BKA82DRAFT_8014 [Pisolithus tinctorius]KIO09205.1 hypothetical protein M404DRAFT_8014 [Pisolithus tinctorius Marx 270]